MCDNLSSPAHNTQLKDRRHAEPEIGKTKNRANPNPVFEAFASFFSSLLISLDALLRSSMARAIAKAVRRK
jgi:hypothetical protein